MNLGNDWHINLSVTQLVYLTLYSRITSRHKGLIMCDAMRMAADVLV